MMISIHITSWITDLQLLEVEALLPVCPGSLHVPLHGLQPLHLGLGLLYLPLDHRLLLLLPRLQTHLLLGSRRLRLHIRHGHNLCPELSSYDEYHSENCLPHLNSCEHEYWLRSLPCSHLICDYILYLQAPWRIYSINWWGWVSFMLNWGYILPKDFKYWNHFTVYPLDLNRLKVMTLYLWSMKLQWCGCSCY